MTLERLQKVLAHRGVASRRASEELISSGKVKVNGVVVTELGTKVDEENDRIEVEGTEIAAGGQEPIVIALNKPKGYVTTVSDPHAEHTVMELVEIPGRRVYPVGRLDKDTRGLLLFTDDGDLAHKLTHPSHGIEKTYRVNAWGEIGPEEMKQLASGVEIEEGKTAPAKIENVRIEGKKIRFTITIREGKKRQIRKMVIAVGGRVSELTRTFFAGIPLGDIPEGAWRILTRREVTVLKRLASATVDKKRTARAAPKRKAPETRTSVSESKDVRRRQTKKPAK